MAAVLTLTRSQIVAFRRRSGSLDERLPAGPESLRTAARAGLQDSVPRSALHSLHARVTDVGADAWEDPALSQVWGLRYTAFVVPAGDHAPFTLGRMPDRGAIRGRAMDIASRLRSALKGAHVDAREAGRRLGVHPNVLRYAALTGTVLIRWDGSRQPSVWTVPRPEVDPLGARTELARRFLHTYGAGTPDTFGRWAGLKPQSAEPAFGALAPSLLPVRTPIGDAHVLAEDEPMLRASPAKPTAARLLPSGDPFSLLWGADRDLLVADATQRSLLWTSRVWPGALLVAGEITGTWRRSGGVITIQPWRKLTKREVESVDREAGSLPLPEVHGNVSVRWD